MGGTTLTERCATLLDDICADDAWSLSPEQRAQYCQAVVAVLVPPCPDATIQRTFRSYHLDHGLVDALRTRTHPAHDDAWRLWSSQAVRIVQRELHTNETDILGDVPDLAQLALEEILTALPSFRYASRFSTWAYSIIARRVHRHRRDARAAKRGTQPVSLDQQRELGRDWGQSQVEARFESNALRVLAATVLAEHSDTRLAEIFALWAIDRERLSEIGSQFGLSVSRVSVLLESARTVLRADARVRDWMSDADICAFATDAGQTS